MTWHDRRVTTRPFQSLRLPGCELTAAGLASLLPAMRRPWGSPGTSIDASLDLSDNPLGDAGVQLVAELLPHTVETHVVGTRVRSPGICQLNVSGTCCGDDGLVALAAALPALGNLYRLECSDLPAVSARGWVALARALPSLRSLVHLCANDNPGVGTEGALAFDGAIRMLRTFVGLSNPIEASSLSEAALGQWLQREGAWGQLQLVELKNCRLNAGAKLALQTVEADRQGLGRYLSHFNILTWDGG